MILNQLKTHFGNAEPVTREFVAFMDATFRSYSEIRSLFFAKLPQHLHQSELVSLINVEIKNRLFEETFCDRIHDALKTLRRAIIRLEDLREAHPEAPENVNDLSQLSVLAERVEALYQKHWEYYRYQNRLNEEEIVAFVLEIDQVGYAWDLYQRAVATAQGLVDTLSGQPCPDDSTPLRITYQRGAPEQFSVNTLRNLMEFLEAGYRYICAVCEIDPGQHPLTLLQLEVSEPVELHLAIPVQAAEPYRKFLQYLFLRDMLKREALLKIVFEAASHDAGREKPLPPAQVAGFQKTLLAQLKLLPQDGRFTISDRAFPDDRVQVLQEFTAGLDAKNINYDALVRGTDTPATSRRRKPSTGPAKADPAPVEPQASPPSMQVRIDGVEELVSIPSKSHISVLTEKTRSES